MIRTLMTFALATLSNLTLAQSHSNPTGGRRRENLAAAIKPGRIETLCSKASLSRASMNPKQDAQSTSLKNFLTRFESSEARKSDPQGYYEGLNKALALLPDGKRLLACLKEATGPNIEEGGQKFVEKGNFATILEGKIGDDKRRKVQTINLATDPRQALVFYAHSLEDACRIREATQRMEDHYRASVEAKKVEDSLPTLTEAQQQEAAAQAGYAYEKSAAIHHQGILTNALAGYRVQINTFAALAEKLPNEFCSYVYKSGIRGGIEISMGEHYADFENQLASGELARFFAEKYISDKLVRETSIYQTVPVLENDIPKMSVVYDLNSNRKVFRPDIIQGLKSEEIPVIER